MRELDFTLRRVELRGGGTLYCRPYDHESYQRLMRSVAVTANSKMVLKQDDLPEDFVVSLLRKHVVRVEGLLTRPQEGDPHPTTVDELLSYGGAVPQLTIAALELLNLSSLSVEDVGKPGAPQPDGSGAAVTTVQ